MVEVLAVDVNSVVHAKDVISEDVGWLHDLDGWRRVIPLSEGPQSD
jgi:hypothetical protein